MVNGVDEQCHRNERGESDSPDICVDHAVAPAAHDVEGTDSYHLENNMRDGKIDDKISKIPSVQKTESLEQFSKDQTGDGSVTAQEIAISNELVASKEGTEEVSKQDILQNIAELSRASSVVDFESPILEVKFVAQENSGMKSPLEALLAGMPDLEVEVPSVMEDNNDGSENGDQYSLISVEGFGAIGSGTDSHMSVDMDYYSLNETPSVIEAAKLDDCYTSSSQEMPAVSLI
ncbi:hypothetical protein OIU84_025453 [Salix udensis]|uniref:Uncharacterized protein n=1 Tax=Salix udensis TaxID=889485 RepID=A0AAD6KJM7_9ROSI|nr:hypothetical protein OIU84_025453 [Salix udensis]